MIFKSKFNKPVLAPFINEILSQVFLVAPIVNSRDKQRSGEITVINK